MTEPATLPLMPVPQLMKQASNDDRYLGRGAYRRDTIWEYGWAGKPYQSDRTKTQVMSYVEWAVSCPQKSCRAGVGQECNAQSVHVHARRVQAYNDRRRHQLRRGTEQSFGEPHNPARPPWYVALKQRRAQRTLARALEAAAFEVTAENHRLKQLKIEAEQMLIDPAMIERVVAHGHKRAQRALKKGAKRGFRPTRAERIERWRKTGEGPW